MISSSIRSTLVLATLTALVASGCVLMKGSEESSDSSETTNEDGSGGGGSTPDPTLTALVGNWEMACLAVANIDGAAASRQTLIEFKADGTFTFLRFYYAGSTCSGASIIWQSSEGSVEVGAATTAPANGHLLRFTFVGNPGLYSKSAGAASHLNSQCGHGTIFNSNNGLGVGVGSWICGSDNRFSMYGIGSIFDAAAVVSGNSLAMTAMTFNAPGVLNGNAVDGITSLNFTK